MKTLISMVFLTFSLVGGPGAHAYECQETARLVNVEAGTYARLAYFTPVSPQAIVLFVLGPGASYKASRVFIRNLCGRGFTIAAFDIRGPHRDERRYLKALFKIERKIVKARPNANLIVYGWSKGADVAVRFANRSPKAMKKIILENPKLSVSSRQNAGRFSRDQIRIFGCRADRRNTKIHGLILTPVHAVSCSPHLSSDAEARGPMIDFIESDFAGVPSSNWYWGI